MCVAASDTQQGLLVFSVKLRALRSSPCSLLLKIRAGGTKGAGGGGRRAKWTGGVKRARGAMGASIPCDPHEFRVLPSAQNIFREGGRRFSPPQ